MTTLTTSGDILNWVLFNANEPIDGTSEFQTHAVDSLNRAYREIWMGGGALDPELNEQWLWLKKDPPGVLTLNPLIETGTVSVTNNNATATLSFAPSTSLAGRFFKVEGHPDIFRIQAHTGGSQTLTLDGVYTGDTDAAASYTIMQLEYTLASDLLYVLGPMRVYSDDQPYIDGVDLKALERDYPLFFVEGGIPTKFAMVTETKVRFNRYGGDESTDLIRVEYDYLAKPSAELADDANEPLIPLQHRQVLADLALMYLLMAKSDYRATDIGALAKAGLRAMAKDNRNRLANYSRSNGAIYPRQNSLPQHRRVVRTSSGFILG